MDEREDTKTREDGQLEVQQPPLVGLICTKSPQGLKERTRGAVAAKWSRGTYG